MARRSKPTGPKPVESFRHQETRTNLPTADAQEYVTPEVEAPRKLLYPRNTALDPQLVWRGKDEEDQANLEVEAPPIYIQEKIDPLALVENLRDTAKAEEEEIEVSLFDDFDGLDELESVDFYRHQSNWANRMILGDSLQVMGSLAERESLRGQVQMIYIDPPYGIKFNSNWQVSTRSKDVKDGKANDIVREAEQIKAFRDTWQYGINSYLSYLRDRLVAARDLLKTTGSVFVQISDENVHLVRSLLDEVFGPENFISQITFATTSGFSQSLGVGREGDYVLWYAKDKENVKIRTLWRADKNNERYNRVRLPDGTDRRATPNEIETGHVNGPGRLFQDDNFTSQGAASEDQTVTYKGGTYRPSASSHWKTSFPVGMDRLRVAGRYYQARTTLRYVRFRDDFPMAALTNRWGDTANSYTNEKIYVVQTGTKVIERCMLMTTDPGDLVLDPTCGSGTTAYVAEQWGRRWIAIDTSRVALALSRQRLMGARFPYYLLEDSLEGREKILQLTGSQIGAGTPPQGDLGLGFVYQTVPRITLKSIANNPDIHEGMSQAEIDAAIARHADQETLFDQPYEDTRKVRISGPFTVESLTPHRSVSFDDTTPIGERDSIASYYETIDDQPFDLVILETLATSGIQNGAKRERLTFESIEPYAGQFVQALGTTAAPEKTVAIAIGPQYGTVSARFVKQAFQEARKVKGCSMLCILGFAFDAHAGELVEAEDGAAFAAGGTLQLGKLNVQFVRMNSDLLMGESLKKTGSGNLFTVFGEPDIEVHTAGDTVTVDLRGVDVFDPTTGEVRSSGTNQIALWMIDSNYNGESFFVRHCYFTGGNDPYKKLKTALKAEIDPEAWASLYRTESRPFPKPDTGQIAVKVINDYGDEVVKVFDVD